MQKASCGMKFITAKIFFDFLFLAFKPALLQAGPSEYARL